VVKRNDVVGRFAVNHLTIKTSDLSVLSMGH
jgi:hypothetical protein